MAEDLEGRSISLGGEDGLHGDRACIGQKQRLANRQLFHGVCCCAMGRRAVERLTSRECHFEVGRGGHHSRAVDAMFVEKAGLLRAKCGFKDRCLQGRRAQLRTQQRMYVCVCTRAVGCVVNPVALALKGVGGQHGARTRRRAVQALPVGRQPAGVERSEARAHLISFGVRVAQRRRPECIAARPGALCIADQRGMRANLHECVNVQGVQSLHHPVKAHRFTHLSPPVARIHQFGGRGARAG